MPIRQLSVFVENRKGKLAEITGVLTKNAIDIRALCVADTKEYGILRLIVNDPDAAVDALRAEGFTVSLTKVLGVGILDQPGGLHGAMQLLMENEIDVEYMYAFIARHADSAYVILRVADNEKAGAILKEAGYYIVSESEIQ